jgi:hypothetical protein
MERALFLLALVLIAAPAAQRGAAAAEFISLIPSSRWLTLGSPWAPKSYDECNELRQSFGAEIELLSAQHDACLEGAPQEESGSAGCSKLSCQPLHSARDSARGRMSEQAALCSRRVAEHLADERAEEEQDRRRAERAQARRAEEESAQRAEQEQADRDRLAQEETEAAERAARERDDAVGRHRQDVDREREMTEHSERASDGQSPSPAWGALDQIEQTEQMAESGILAGRVAAELGSNPFEGAQAEAAIELGARADATMLGEALDLATGDFGPAQSDPGLDRAHSAAERAHAEALGTNPFAKAISGLALSGVEHLQNKAIGETVGLTEQVASIGINAPETENTRPATMQASPLPAGKDPAASQGRAADPANPFAKPLLTTSRDEQQAHAGGGSRGRVATLEADDGVSGRRENPDNPFARRAQLMSSTYYDPISRATFSISPGSTLFRDGRSQTLKVIPMPSAERRYGDGARCTADGLGIVTPACEAERRRLRDGDQKATAR